MSSAAAQQPQVGLFGGVPPAPRPPSVGPAGLSPELSARNLQSTFEDLRSGGPELSLIHISEPTRLALI
eukprot:3183732-Alexandrium_andersonii.AAC.1